MAPAEGEYTIVMTSVCVFTLCPGIHRSREAFQDQLANKSKRSVRTAQIEGALGDQSLPRGVIAIALRKGQITVTSSGPEESWRNWLIDVKS